MEDQREELWYYTYSQRLERDNEELTLKLKTIGRNHEKELMGLRILYQSEKEKTQSLEDSLKKYPATLMKVKSLQNKLQTASAKIKMLKATLEEVTSSHSKEFILKRLETELESYKTTTLAELKQRDAASQKLKREFDQLKTAFDQLQVENQSLRVSLLNEKDEKTEVITLKQHFEADLEEANRVIEFLKKELKTNAIELRAEEQAKCEDKMVEVSNEVERLNRHLSKKDEKVKELKQKLEKLRQEKIDIGVFAEELEHKNTQLLLEKQQLNAQFKMKNQTIQELEESLQHQVEDAEVEHSFSLQEINKEKLILANKLAETERAYQKLIEDKEEEIDAVKTQLSDLQRAKEYTETEKNRLKERIGTLQQEASALKQQIREKDETLAASTKDAKAQLKEALLKVTTQRDELRQQLEDLQNQIDFNRVSIVLPGASLFDDIGNTNLSTRTSFARESVANRQSIENLQLELNQKEFIIKQLEKHNQDLITECNSLQQTVQTLKDTLPQDTEQIEIKNQQIQDLLQQQQLLQDECAALQEKLNTPQFVLPALDKKASSKSSYLSTQQQKRKESLIEILETKEVQAVIPVEVEIEGSLEEKDKIIRELMQEQLELYEQINFLEELARTNAIAQEEKAEAQLKEILCLRESLSQVKTQGKSLEPANFEDKYKDLSLKYVELEAQTQQQIDKLVQEKELMKAAFENMLSRKALTKSTKLVIEKLPTLQVQIPPKILTSELVALVRANESPQVQALYSELRLNQAQLSEFYSKIASLKVKNEHLERQIVVYVDSSDPLILIPSKSIAELSDKSDQELAKSSRNASEVDTSQVESALDTEGGGDDLFNPKVDNEALYTIMAEKEMYKAEVNKLQAQLTLHIEEWALYNNQLREDLEKEQKSAIKLSTRVKQLELQILELLKEPRKTNKTSRWKNFFRMKKRKESPSQLSKM